MPLSEEVFFLDPDFRGSLQSQIRQIVASAILSGRFLPGERLPSSRKLAQHLKISRITVTLAYQELVADGYLSSSSRSGFFVSEDAPTSPLNGMAAIETADRVDWDHFLQADYTGAKTVEKLGDWRHYRHPFIYGQADPELFNHSNWRLCAHQALGKKEFDSLTSDYDERDDPELIDFIARHTLPRRGILAKPDEILVTVGAQNALWMVAQLLLGKGRNVVYENPGYPGLRAILDQSECNRFPLGVDHEGLDPEDLPEHTDVLFVTPSHQAPTAATMSMARRHALLRQAKQNDFLIVEDDYEFEMSFLTPPSPALKSLDREGRVIYTGSFSKSLFPGLRLGYLVGSEAFIRQARSLRSTVLRHPPGHIQRTTAYFLALGHYDALIKQMRDAFYERRSIMAQALLDNNLKIAGSSSFGGSSFWMEAPEHVDTKALALELRKDSVLIEPGAPFFEGRETPKNFYRLAYSSINAKHIPEGIDKIARTLRKNW